MTIPKHSIAVNENSSETSAVHNVPSVSGSLAQDALKSLLQTNANHLPNRGLPAGRHALLPSSSQASPRLPSSRHRNPSPILESKRTCSETFSIGVEITETAPVLRVRRMCAGDPSSQLNPTSLQDRDENENRQRYYHCHHH